MPPCVADVADKYAELALKSDRYNARAYVNKGCILADKVGWCAKRAVLGLPSVLYLVCQACYILSVPSVLYTWCAKRAIYLVCQACYTWCAKRAILGVPSVLYTWCAKRAIGVPSVLYLVTCV